MTCAVQGCTGVLRSDNHTGFCRDHGAERHRAHRNEDQKWGLVRQAKQRANRDGLECTITVDDFEIPEFCPYLLIPIMRCPGVPCSTSPSLDRIDNSRGYVPGNVQVLSYAANSMKRDATTEQLMTFATNVIRLHQEMSVQTVDRIPCPKCHNEGPHERMTPAPDGSYRTAVCSKCASEWKIFG